jgi:signal transduction histidine kinase
MLGSQLGILVENARLYQDLELKDELRGELLRQLITAQEDERKRVARDLHDVISQILSTLSVKLQNLDVREDSMAEQKAQIQEASSLIAETSREIHRLIHDLGPTLLDDLGLFAAVRSMANETLKASGIEVYVEEVGRQKRLTSDAEVAIFRIIQEAMTNIVKHANAESVFVSLDFKEDALSVQIEDDGIGFELPEKLGKPGSRSGIGLTGMKERAELLGGTLTIDSKLGRGTKLGIEIPLNQNEG